jgi:hypothetical protein
MREKIGMRNEELGIPYHPPMICIADGCAAFLIPNSYFLIHDLQAVRPS